MAMLNDEQIRKFQELHRNRFGSEISREDAIDQGGKLINLMSLIMQAMAARQDQEMAAKGNPETKDQ
ncbi:hypothetical protein HZA73_07200 [candidate division TA06 bacterium]|nr:hypothetical protein [candidate division TA06 bacterium]